MAAQHLVDGQRIRKASVAQIGYHHLMFDQHEVIRANGVLTESLHCGDGFAGIMSREAEAEMRMVRAGDAGMALARPAVRRREAPLLRDLLGLAPRDVSRRAPGFFFAA